MRTPSLPHHLLFFFLYIYSVTSVGGTQGVAPEVAVSRFYSGGGFSNYFPTPDFQKEAVEGYLEKLPTGTYAGLYNP